MEDITRCGAGRNPQFREWPNFSGKPQVGGENCVNTVEEIGSAFNWALWPYSTLCGFCPTTNIPSGGTLVVDTPDGAGVGWGHTTTEGNDMSEQPHTPTTAEVRLKYESASLGQSASAEFDRWLRQAKAEAVREHEEKRAVIHVSEPRPEVRLVPAPCLHCGRVR